MISTLSFVPIADTILAFDTLCNHACSSEHVRLDYFMMNDIGEFLRGRRMQPRLPHEMWNMMNEMWNMNLRVQKRFSKNQ